MIVKSRLFWIAAGLLLLGCAGSNPFTAARFAGGFQDTGGGGGTPPPGGGDVNSTCDLAGADKFLSSFRLVNRSTRRVSYSMTFIASAGSGGFVCEQDRTTYLNAGYRALSLDSTAFNAAIGCDTVQLTSGTQLLGLTLTGQIAADPSGGTDQAQEQNAASPLNGAVAIPVPQLIVLGDGQSNFICQGSNACTQGGFAYTSDFGTLISKITSLRTQGTLCNTGLGSRPEWLLLDPNLEDTERSAFQYVVGSSIEVQILNRPDNTNPQVNQAVWRIISSEGTTLQDFLP